MKFLNLWSAIGQFTQGEELPQDSMTVPDMSLSVKDILARYRRGTIDVQSLYRQYPDSDDDFDDAVDGIDDFADVYYARQQNYDNIVDTINRHNQDKSVPQDRDVVEESSASSKDL